jgi:hypothetical protein
MPQFEIGEKNILFLKGNERRMCPLLGWNQGRFIVVKDIVLSGDGRTVLQKPDGTLGYGPVDTKHWHPPSPRLGQPETVKQVSKSKDSADVSSEQATKSSQQEQQITTGKRLSYHHFVKYIKGQVKTLHTAQELKALKPMPSANIKERFYVPAARPVPLRLRNEKQM